MCPERTYSCKSSLGSCWAAFPRAVTERCSPSSLTHALLSGAHTHTAAPSNGLLRQDRHPWTSRWWWSSDSSPWRICPAQQSRQPGGERSNTGAHGSATTQSAHKWDEVRKGGGSYQDLRSGAHGFFVFGNNTDVEDSGENENEARSWGGAWKDTKKSGTRQIYRTDFRWFCGPCKLLSPGLMVGTTVVNALISYY